MTTVQNGLPRPGRVEPERAASTTADAVSAASGRLLALQREDGSWDNPRPGAVSGAGGAVLAFVLAHESGEPGEPGDVALTDRACAWLLRVRRSDGGWGTLDGCPSDVVATSMAATALALWSRSRRGSELPDAAAAVSEALAWLGEHGGVPGIVDPTVRQLCGLVLAAADLARPRGLPGVPVEVVLLPARLRRRALSYLSPPLVALALLQRRFGHLGPLRRGVHRLARPAALRLLHEVTRAEGGVGSFGGDPWLTGLVTAALAVNGAAPDLVRSGLAYLRRTAQPDGSWAMIHGMEAERVELTGPAFAAAALGDAGHAASARLTTTRAWLADCRQSRPFPLYDCPPGGWTWSGAKGWPNVLDSLAVLEVLAQGPADGPALTEGLAWLRSRQDRRGTWSTFVRNTLVPLDGPCPYITARALRLLFRTGVPISDPDWSRGLRALLSRQQADGGFEALWHRGPVPATAAVLRLLAELGLATTPAARRAAARLVALQRPDGSWSTEDPAEPGTVDETARAVLALTAHGAHPAAARGERWLVDRQRPDGSWEPGQTCVYIRGHVHYSDHLMAQGLALSALAARLDTEARV
ncbi:prenyltransferase/squalene oxidase repeat-containing protein [Streptacidiphilus jiangxiensis]|uniref:Squalene-hopene/tetraprenyl-beta-curcumene cyclase n=1 Tax=Streptacidiphilus jiangxiensis TaxID=235985 RepID=A0A1H7KKC5_STRJI|nr:prenyltransferase/squalene oxidase repeat-containing protein [Streptacidiphilus jiangxiensis]SEK86960.1 squalene-hopene/tetraprenyl-beta-curcumene cyclase [Streptacidiphilus jiangxiensis]